MKKALSFIIGIVIISHSCNNANLKGQLDSLDGHDHGSELTESYSIYTENFELYVEFNSLIVGQVSEFVAHFTHLSNYKPVESGSVTVSLTKGKKGIRKRVDSPARIGIFTPSIKPLEAGDYTLIFDLTTQGNKNSFTIKGVTVYPDEKNALESVGKEPDREGISYTKEQSWKTDFATELVKEEPFGQVIKTTAQVQSAQGDEILVSAKTGGIVRLSTDKILEGKSVSNRQVLFSISGNGLADNNFEVQFLEAQNNFQKAKSDFERLKELAKDKIVSEKDLVNAKNQYGNAKAIYDNLNKNFNSSGQSVTSPMNGFIKQLYVKNGQYVETGQPIVSISQNKTLILRAEVQQKYFSILGAIYSANIRTLHDNQTYTLEQLNGKVISFGRSTNMDNYLIPVNVEIDNKGSFVSGGFLELYLKTLTNKQALTIPNTALLEEQGSFSVFVQITPELFEKRQVKPGATDGLKTEILKGIIPSERIVTKGAIFIKLAQATGALDAHSGHVH